MSEAFWLQFWPECFVGVCVLVALCVIGSEGRHWVESAFSGPIKARTDQSDADRRLEQAKAERIKAEQDAADRAYLRALGDTETIKTTLQSRSTKVTK